MSAAVADQVSLVVAVTGHRDLVAAELPRIRACVRAFLQDLRRRFPALPLLVVTPIAEGADRLVAEVAAEEGIQLLLVLPMPKAIYREDFDELARAEFDRLLTLGESIELPLVGTSTADSISTSRAARDLQYERLGVYIAAHCHVLLALWDGEPSTAAGGTAHVVRFHQQDVAELLDDHQQRSPIDFSEDESDLVYHVWCSRRSAPGPLAPALAGTGRWLTRDELEGATLQMPDRYQAVLQRMMEFNQDLASSPNSPASVPLVEEPYADISRCAGDIERVYLHADAQAGRFQRKALRTLRATYTLAALAGLSFVLYADLTAQQGMLLAYLLFIGLGAMLYLAERRGNWYRRYLDYRALAEGLRVQFFWALAGVPMASATQFSHDCFMKRQDLELGWIRNVMRYAGRRANAVAASAPERGTEMAARVWVGDAHTGQTGYYASKALERRRRARFTNLLGAASFAVGIGCALLLAASWGRIGVPWSNVLIALMGVLPYMAAVRQSYAQRVAERELINQYSYMQRLYRNAHLRLRDAAGMAVKQDVLRAVGEAALDENALWLLRQRERPLSGSQVFHPN
ncbi:MAG: hypothetical protein R3E86_03315 [Pseudomonadales bacterium]